MPSNLSIRRLPLIGLLALLLIVSGAIAASTRGGAAPATQPAAAAPAALQMRLVREGNGDQPVDWLSDPSGPAGSKIPVLRQVLLDGKSIAAVSPYQDAQQQTCISVKLTSEGAQRLKQITADNIGRRLAIVSDGQVLLAPTIRSTISGGSVSLSIGKNISNQQRQEILKRLGGAPNPPPTTLPTTRPGRDAPQ